MLINVMLIKKHVLCIRCKVGTVSIGAKPDFEKAKTLFLLHNRFESYFGKYVLLAHKPFMKCMF